MAALWRGRYWYVKALLVIATSALLFWLGQGWIRPQRALAKRVAAQLETASPAQRAQHMRHLAAFGEAGLPYLAAALKHERIEIATEARLVLSEELDRWQLLKPHDASRRLAKLANELAQGIEGCSPPTRRMASDLATRILLWPVDAAVVDQQRLIADCERVLVAVRGREEPTLAATEVATASFTPRAAARLSPLDDELTLPGGGLPTEMTRVPALPPEAAGQPRALPHADEPELAPAIPAGEEPRRFFPETTSTTPSHAPQAKPGDTTVSQIYRLVSADSDEREAAETALRAIGFGEVHLAVARKFADPQPEVRRQLVDQLARQSVVDARPWLLRLLGDEDARVRLAVAHVLATSGDPQILYALRQQAIDESDPAVRQVLDRATQ